ncbi:YggT family protein [Dongshaea marina]|uniref:YggT family protein n=1 Tax=Dongshaea marina TaxID=2047966 RepID=UPI000D3EDB7F|nr:YggT family protein [Dongshaea marina]
MSALSFLIESIVTLYLYVVILRFWLQLARADFYNPVSQFVVKLTNPILAPMRKVIPSPARIDTPAIILAFVVSLIFVLLRLNFEWQQIGVIWVQIGMLAVLTMIKKAGVLLCWLLIIQAIMSWVSQGRNPIEFLLYQLTEPFLGPIRRIIPPIGGLDLSLLVLFLILQALNILFATHIFSWGYL